MGFQSTFCTGAANAEKDARLHQTTPISMTAEVSHVELAWHGEANDVSVAGEFSNWVPLSMAKKSERKWSLGLLLKHGEYSCKFIVDGVWTTSPDMEVHKTDDGFENNLLKVMPTPELSDRGEDETELDFDDKFSGEHEMAENYGSAKYLNAESPSQHQMPALGSEKDEVAFSLSNAVNHLEEVRQVFEGSKEDDIGSSTFEEEKKDEVTLSLNNAMSQLDEVREVFGAEHEVLGNSVDLKEETKERSNLGDAKMNSLDVVSVQAETSDIVLRWIGAGKEVEVAGNFSNWEGLSMALDQEKEMDNLSQDDTSDLVQRWSIWLKLQNKVHRLHFLVDGVKVLSDGLDKDALPGGEPTNLIVVGPDNATTEDSVSEQIIATSLQQSRDEPFDQIEIPMIRTEEEQMRVFLGTQHGEEAEDIVIPFVRSEEEQLRVFCGVKRPDESDEALDSTRISVEQSFIKDAVNDVNSLESVREYADARFYVANLHGRDDVTLSLQSALDKIEDVKEVFLESNDGFKAEEGFNQAKAQEMPNEAETTEGIKAVREVEKEAVETKASVESEETKEMGEEAQRASEAEAQQIAEEERKEAEIKA